MDPKGKHPKPSDKRRKKDKSKRRHRPDVPELNVMELKAVDSRKVLSFTEDPRQVEEPSMDPLPSPPTRMTSSLYGPMEPPQEGLVFDQLEGKTPEQIRLIKIRRRQKAFEMKRENINAQIRVRDEELKKLEEEREQQEKKGRKRKRKEEDPKNALPSLEDTLEIYRTPATLLESETPQEVRKLQIKCEQSIANSIEDQQIGSVLHKFLLSTSEKRNLHLMKNRDVSASLCSIWNILLKNFTATVDYYHILEFFKKIFILFLPMFEQENIAKIAENYLDSLQTREKRDYNQIEFFDVMIKMADIFLEVPDISSYCAFYDFLKNRLTYSKQINGSISDENGLNTTISPPSNLDGVEGDSNRGQENIGNIQKIELKFYKTEDLNTKFGEELKHEEQPQKVLYCLERFIKVENFDDEQDTGSEGELSTGVISTKQEYFLEDQDIIPLGNITNDTLALLQNSESAPNPEVIEIIGQELIMPFLIKKSSLFYLGFVIEDSDSNIIRLNPSLFRAIYYESLATKQGTVEVFNLLEYDDSILNNIDRVAKLKQRWKDASSEAPAPQAFELVGKQPEQVVGLLIQGKYRYTSLREDPSKFEDVNYHSSDAFQGIKSENLNFLSTREDNLPFDSASPYHDDLITYAKERSFNIIVHGLPKTGKSDFCKKLAKKLDLELVDTDLLLENFLKRVTEGEEEVEMDDDDNPIEFLAPVERKIVTDLRNGLSIDSGDMVTFLESEFSKMRLDQKGFVYEAPCYEPVTSSNSVLVNILKGKLQISESKKLPFNYVIELKTSEEEMFERAATLFENQDIEDFCLTTNLQRKEREALKKRAEWMQSDEYEPEEGADEEEEPLDPEDIKLLKKEDLFRRVNEDPTRLAQAFQYYQLEVRPKMQEVGRKLHYSNNISLDYSTLTTEQAISTVCGILGPRAQRLRPVASVLEETGEDNFTGLPQHELELEAGQPMRRWSLFSTQDPVALFNGQVATGSSEFAADYAGRVFVFKDEANLKTFHHNPKPYLLQKPKLPNLTYNIVLAGMSKTGKTEYANRLAKHYNLKVLKLQDYLLTKVQERLQEMERVEQAIKDTEAATAAYNIQQIKLEQQQLGEEEAPKEQEILSSEQQLQEGQKPPTDATVLEEGQTAIEDPQDTVPKAPRREETILSVSNPYEGTISLSKAELQDIMKGKPFDVRHVLPLLLAERGVQFYERPAPGPTLEEVNEAQGEGEDVEEVDEEELARRRKIQLSKLREEALIKFEEARISKTKDIESLEELTKQANEIPLSDIVPLPNQDGTIPETKGYIFIDFPSSEEHLTYLKEMNIPIDRVVLIKENEEEEPGNDVTRRPHFYEEAHLETEIASFAAQAEVLREEFGEGGVLKEIEISTLDETYLKIRQFIDPFYVRIDDEDTQLPEDNGEDGDNILFGEYFKYCPVTLVDDGWLVLGNEEFTAQVRGRKYWFYGEEQKEKFEKRIDRYILGEHSEQYAPALQEYLTGEGERQNGEKKLEIPKLPDPRIFFSGCIGSGLRTTLKLLRSKLKIPVLNFRDEFKDLYYSEKKYRMELRLLQGKSKELEWQAPEEDSEEDYDPLDDSMVREEDDEDFSDEKNQIDVVRRIFERKDSLLYNMRLDFTPATPKVEYDFEGADVIEEEEEEDEDNGEGSENKEESEEKEESDEERRQRLKQERRKERMETLRERSEAENQIFDDFDLKQVLSDAVRLPEVFVLFRSKKKTMLDRKLDKARIQREYDEIIDKLEDIKARRRAKFEKSRKKELAVQLEEDPDFDDSEFMPFTAAEVYEGMPEPPVLKDFLQAEKDRLVEMWTTQTEQLEKIKEDFEEIGVRVVVVKTDFEVERVFTKTKAALRPHLDGREAILSRHLAVPIKDSENEDELTLEKKVEQLCAGYYFQESRFAKKNAVLNSSLLQKQSFPLLFNQRIYYLSSKEERSRVASNPAKYLRGLAPPQDSFLRPRVFFIGKYKSGKSSIVELLESHMDTVVVRVDEVLELFVQNETSGLGRELNNILRQGLSVPDELLVRLLALRLKFADVRQKGYVLDGFPRTKQQVSLMYKWGIVPDLVFSDPITSFEVKSRLMALEAQKERDLQALLDKKNQKRVGEDGEEIEEEEEEEEQDEDEGEEGQDLNQKQYKKIMAADQPKNFGLLDEIFEERLEVSEFNTTEVENVFQYNFQNLRYLTKKSKNAKLRQILTELGALTQAKQQIAIRNHRNQPFEASFLSVKKATIMNNVGRSLVFSPVAYKKKRSFVASELKREPLVYYKRKYYMLSSLEELEDFQAFPGVFQTQEIAFERMAKPVSVEDLHFKEFQLRGYCPVSLYLGKCEKGQSHIALSYQSRFYQFSSVKNMRVFFRNPSIFSRVKIPEKLKITLKKEALKESRVKGDLEGLLHNEMSRLVVRCMNQLAFARIKYPTISEQSTALKLMALCLKSSNPQRNQQYRQKYKAQMKKFISDCLLPKQIQEETERRETEKGPIKKVKKSPKKSGMAPSQEFKTAQKDQQEIEEEKTRSPTHKIVVEQEEASRFWTDADESHFLKLTEEFTSLMNRMKAELTAHDYFNKFIRQQTAWSPPSVQGQRIGRAFS